MSGYLRRLARRTLGTDVPLHSAVALPFAAPPTVVEPDVSSDTDIVAVPFRQASIDAAQPAPRADDVRLSAYTPPVSEKVRDPQKLKVPRPPATTAGETNAHRLFTSQRLTPQSSVVHPAERTFTPPAVPSVLGHREFAPQPATRATRQLGSARATPAMARADVAASAPPAMRSVERERHPPLAPEPSEVHVHIGRIDVTAVPAQPVLKRAPREKPKQMSLSEYLGRRRSGGR